MRATIATVLLVASTSLLAYDTDTHALITSHTFERSVAATGNFQTRYGLDRFPDTIQNYHPFRVPEQVAYAGKRDAYLDMEASSWFGLISPSDTRPEMPYDWANMASLSGENYREDGVERLRAKGWLMRGVIREDDIPIDYYTKEPKPDPDPHGEFIRVFHHFFDPISNSALLFQPACDLFPSSCSRSPDWAFGRNNVAGAGSNPVDSSRRNHFTWADAREATWCALTYNAGPLDLAGQDAAVRRLCWATAFKSLGHVLHLLQDSAQPQHVRDDPHNHSHDWPGSQLNTGIERRMYEAWTNYRATGGREVGELPDGNEESQFRTFFAADDQSSPALVTSGYPTPRFSEPHYYFTTRQVENTVTPATLKTRRGLADLANRNFFSEGSILSDDFPLPPSDPESSDYTVKQLAVTKRFGFGEIREEHMSVALVDPLKGNYVDASLAKFGNLVPLASVSLWEEYAPNDTSLKAGVISLDEYSAHADVLIPRAIAYSAGLIDYFFRGKLEITQPLDGLFSVIDHGTPHTVNAKGYPIRSDDSKVFGFTKLRLRVRNATDVVNESGTNLPIPRDVMSTSASAVPLQGDPTLVAVARYHRNPCYKPDLSGERRIAFDGVVTEPAGCGADGTRTPFQELSVSKPAISSAAAMNGTGQDIVFDFGNQPIPVNATDLALQVVYRGPLGLESDAIAVGSFDVREPTYLTHWNNSDYAGCGGGWYPNGATPPGCIVEGFGAKRAILTTRLCIGTQMVFEHLENAHGSLGTGDFVRLVALLDDAPKATRSRSVVHHLSNAEIRNRGIAGHLRQSDKEQATAAAPFVSEPFFSKRGLVGSLRPLPYYQINGTDPQPANDAGALDVGALATPLEVAMAPSPGNIKFPDVGESSMACTTSSNKALFADELAHAARSKTSSWH